MTHSSSLPPPRTPTSTSPLIADNSSSDQFSSLSPSLPPSHSFQDDTLAKPLSPNTTSTPRSGLSPLGKLASLIDKVGEFAMTLTPRSDSDASPVYTNLTNMTYYTPQQIAIDLADTTNNTTPKNQYHPIPFPVL